MAVSKPLNTIKPSVKQLKTLDILLKRRYSLIYGGRRSGKTFIILFFILLRAKAKKSRHVIVRFHFADLKKSMMKDTFPKVCEAMNLEYTMNNQDNYAKLPNGSEIWFCGIDEARGLDKVLGTEYSTMFFNEASQIKYSTYQFVLSSLAEKSGLRTTVIIDENPPLKSHWTYKVFFEGIDPMERTLIPNFKENYEHYKINPSDNLENIDSEYMEQLNNLPPKLRKRFRDGEFGDDIVGALFTEKNINKNRIIVDADIREAVIDDLELVEIVVSVDPAISSNAQSDETGILVVGRDIKNRGYTLDDKSGIYKPSEWAAIAVDLYREYDADYIVGEINQGGEMVEHTVKVEDENVPFKSIRATKGKILRAEPISAIYEDDRISHVGSFPDLEEEMVTYTGTKGERSPNRLDALVHGFTALFPVGREKESEYFRGKLVFISPEQTFENSVNIGYIRLTKSENYNFSMLCIKLKDNRAFMTDVLFNDSFPSENFDSIKKMVETNNLETLYVEAPITYAPFVRELMDHDFCPVRGIKSVEQNDNRVLIESKFIIDKFVIKKEPESVEYKEFIRQTDRYTALSEPDETFAPDCLSGAANILKKLHPDEIN
jgi:phage terminase large subunit-like protein